ncbi:MAG: peptidylprolyl isomerase [Oceanospirillaceae bacterium]|nr:peptidylprolyl isomerase [Oceanospirillaceae bacterium]MBT11656.1 peptidylprolyl isomerase [Oceanospirillaceae bacterium]|tara:strand:+ start:197 stop:502 length:306 start_codon:yes stop_codon:yes gene_type:complete
MSTLALHHILLKSPLLANDVMKELSLGADFAELASEYSACPSARQQGFAGYHNTDQLPAELLKALAGHDDESLYCGPVKTTFGYHILKVTDKPERTLLVDE